MRQERLSVGRRCRRLGRRNAHNPVKSGRSAWHCRCTGGMHGTPRHGAVASCIDLIERGDVMAHKQVLFRSDAREKVLKGVNALADAVRVTLGPKSKSVLIEKKFGTPLVCDDGVTIAKEMDLEDPVENLGAQMVRQAAERTGDAVGDGTSTSTILAQAIFADGVRNVAAGASAVDLKRGLDRGVRAVVASLRALSRPVHSRLEKAEIATISTDDDRTSGELGA